MVVLSRLMKTDLEQVRRWRTSDAIRSRMEYQGNITPEMQQNWFKTINNNHNYFFIIHFHNQAIGLIQLQNINPEDSVAESGLFIGDPSYWGSPIPFAASLPLLDFGINVLGIREITAKVSEDNHQAIDYNKHLGFTIGDSLGAGFLKMSISKDSFSSATENQKAFDRFKKNYILSGFDQAFISQGTFIQ
ncbi:GNAT family N-acetyltransferase [Marinoscillum sp.]|uniref:GNAT family N-acetyltransferase n=1 Tax=Marinoscillum sp. TaxID=2024838 RepID=UPI003BAD044C